MWMKSRVIISMLSLFRRITSFRFPLCSGFFISVSDVSPHTFISTIFNLSYTFSTYHPYGFLLEFFPFRRLIGRFDLSIFTHLRLSSQLWDLSSRFIFVLSSLTHLFTSFSISASLRFSCFTFTSAFFKTFPFSISFPPFPSTTFLLGPF